MRYLHLPDDEDRPRLAALVEDRVVDLAGVIPGTRSIDDLVRAGPEVWERVRTAAQARVAGASQDPPSGPLPPPLARSPKIVAMEPRRTGEPAMFAKFASSLAGPGMPISWPTDVTRRVAGQAKLGVIVGRRLRRASPDECLDGVFGYTAANDLTARDLQDPDGQWTRGKNLDGFCPIGPLIVTADECEDPQGLRISTYINSVVMQESSMDDMNVSLADLLSYASWSFTLHPGDLLLIGAPEAAGASRGAPAFLSPGDEVTVSIEGIGDLTNPVLPHLEEAS